MKEIVKITKNSKEVIARINCSDFEIDLLDKYLVKLSKIETKEHKLLDRDIEVRYVINDVEGFTYDEIKHQLECTIDSKIKSYNDKIDLINVITKRSNKRNGRPINESLLKHYE
jgi:hypothetical protein